MKRFFLRGIFALLLLAIVGATILAVLVYTDESWARRAEMAPLLARSALRNLRPTPIMPTPPPAAAVARQQLLNHAGSAPLRPTPTLAAPLVAVAPSAGEAQPVPATPLPSTPTSTPVATATATAQPLAAHIALSGVQHAYQLWNNCGPVTIAMNLSYYDVYRDQREAAAFLKPDQDDKNVSPEQLVAYANSQGLEGTIRMGGTVELLQRLINGGFPVIVEDWMEPEDRGGIGHYRLFTGYDLEGGYFIAQDSYYGPERQMAFASFDEGWRVFNRKYIVIFPPQQAGEVRRLLGPMADDQLMLDHALQVASAEADGNPEDPFAWFNLGTTYTALSDYERAAFAYDEARRIGLPFRMFWYQMEPFGAYLHAGRQQELIALAEATLQSTGPHEELYYYQGLAYRALGDQNKAVDRFQRALDYNPNFSPAGEALAELQPAAGS